MSAPVPVQHPGVFVEFSGRDQPLARELSQLVKLFLEGSMYKVRYLSEKVEGITLVVTDE